MTIAACWSRWTQPAMTNTNHKVWIGVLMTEDFSVHWPTKPSLRAPLLGGR